MVPPTKQDVGSGNNQIFPPAVTEAETAIPAFIGYTQIAKKEQDNDLILQPVKISSLTDYENFFGFPKEDIIQISVTGNATTGWNAVVQEPSVSYLMYYSLKMFFDNGGTQCYIVSTGLYRDVPVINLKGDSVSDPATGYGLLDGLNAVASVGEPALLIFPEMTKLSTADYETLAQAALAQCAEVVNRFCIFDIYNGDSMLDGTSLPANRSYFGLNNLEYGAAYYPFLKTNINFYINPEETNVMVFQNMTGENNTRQSGETSSGITLLTVKSQNGLLYNFVRSALQNHFLMLPACGAVAGVYAAIDTAHGVWKAPANVNLTDVNEPVITINDSLQGELNIDATSGKSINTIREFTGRGTLIWGARTLAGNDNEWRYIQVRRFSAMVKASVTTSTGWAVFEPNNTNTWMIICNTVNNYLIRKWQEGALMGATAQQAFFVKCGLGVTMTQQDIAEGNLTIIVGLALIRPAEFILLTISHKLQPA